MDGTRGGGRGRALGGFVAIAAAALLVWAFAIAPDGTSGPPAAAAEPAPSPSSPSPTPASEPSVPAVGLDDMGLHPPLLQNDGWLQSDVTSLEELRGKVVIVHMWTFGCINCKRTLPNLQEIYSAYPREQVEIVGIHAPEFEHEKDVDRIQAAADELGVTWPIVLDTDKHSFRSWQEGTRYWPRTYVLDRDGHIRFDHIGEGAYQQLRDTVASLVAA